MEISHENTRKVWILSIIGILSLILLTIGATYAYFTFSSDNQFGSQTIEATTEAIGSGVTLTKVGEPLTLDVSALEMLEENIGTSYYASGSSTPAQIGKISVAGEGTFTCTYTMSISATSTSEGKNLYTKFQNFEDKGEGQIYLDINDTRYDFNTSGLFPITYNGEIKGIDSSADQYITANMTIVNNELDQTVLNDGDISLTFEVTEFNCELNESEPIGEYLLANPSSGLNTTMEGGLYRYQGTNETVNNYLCFGYSDYETDCDFTNADNSDKYAYRIIGINESGQLKLIKKEALNTAYAWNSTGTSWNSAALYTNLNGSYFYSNTTYVPTSWQSKIAESSWKYGEHTNANVTASSLYTTESGWTSKVSNYIGLMYAHDYTYAYQREGLNCSGSGDYTTCKNAWIYLWQSGNDSSAPSSAEWTMSRYSNNIAWIVYNDGYLNYSGMSFTYSVRPVFFLENTVEYVEGIGTSAEPFIIK